LQWSTGRGELSALDYGLSIMGGSKYDVPRGLVAAAGEPMKSYQSSQSRNDRPCQERRGLCMAQSAGMSDFSGLEAKGQ
jgi:hypothetical protein